MSIRRLSTYPDEIRDQGFAVVPNVIDSEMLTWLRDVVDSVSRIVASGKRARRSHGVRNLLNVAPELRMLETHIGIRALIDPIEGKESRIVRSIFFDKTPQANWKVAWHQDVTIAVRGKIPTPGFEAWSAKDSITHAQAPVWLLERILTVRLHLDGADQANGALRVLPGSHCRGRLTSEEILEFRGRNPGLTCGVPAGGALAMRPLLVHCSSAALRPSRRRVVHLEFSRETLPGGLDWYYA